MIAAWAVLARALRGIAKHPIAALVAVGAAVLTAWTWWQRRKRGQAEERADRAEIERDAAAGSAVVAERTAAVVTAAAESREAGHALAEEIDHAVPPDAAPADAVRSVDAVVREIARREGADAGGDRAAPVREPAAPAAARGPGRRVPER